MTVGMPTVVVTVKTVEGGLWIVPQVRALRARGARVIVLLPEGPGRLVAAIENLAGGDPGVTLERTRFDFRFAPRWATVRGLLDMRRTLHRLNPDAVLYHLYATALTARLALFGRRGVHAVHMVAGPLYLESPRIRTIERLLMRFDDHLIAGSDHTAARYRALGRREATMTTVPYGVDTDRFAPPSEALRAGVRAQARAALGLPEGALVVTMVAYVYAPKSMVHPGQGIKGHAVLLDAWQRFRRDEPTARLLLVGGGFGNGGKRYRQELILRFGGLGALAAAGVTWVETVDDVRDAYRAADLSVSPSLSENHGAALEAGAMGCPSIVSDAGGLPETVDAMSGWIVPAGDATALADALRSAAADHRDGQLAARGRAARELVVRRFDGSACADRVAMIVLSGATQRRGVR